MKKTLYISDLDGTLLNREGLLSSYTKRTLTRLLEKGVLFSIATARSHQASKIVLDQLPLSVPVVLTNGVAIYDTVRQRYLETHPIPRELLTELNTLFTRFGVSGFLYTLENEVTHVFHTRLTSPLAIAYRDERKIRYNGNIYECEDLYEATARYTPLYFVVYGQRATLEAMRDAFAHLPEIAGSLYENVYEPGHYFMDIFTSACSKATGMRTVMQLCGADEVVAFGDNYNDLPMLKAADRAYVPQNAVEEAKAVATGVVAAHYEDGVARFLEQDTGL